MSGRDEDSNIPEDSRGKVQVLKEMFTLYSEQEIYAMLLECKMDTREAITRLLSQGSFQQVKSKRDKKKEVKEKRLIMGERDEESRVNTDNILGDLREVVQKLKEVVNCSEQETYKMLVKCNMNPDEAVNRLLSQDILKQVKSKEDNNKESNNTSDCQRVYSSNQIHEFTNGGDSYDGQYGRNKFHSDDTSNVQGINNHVAGSSTTSAILGPPPLNSDLTKRVPISSSEAVHSLSVPSSRLISALGCGASGQKTMADVVKMSVNKAPVKDDCPLPENRDFPISFIESPPLNQLRELARINQLRDSASVYNQNFQDDEYRGSRLLCDKYNNKNAKDPSASVNLVECLAAFRCLNIRGDEYHEEEEQPRRRNVANRQMAYQINSNDAHNYHSSSNYDQTEPTQENQNKSSSATDFTFDDNQLFNPVMTPSEPSLQRQNFNTFPSDMHQQIYTREPDSQYSANPLHLSMPVISSLGRRLPSSITDMNGQAMTQQVYMREPDPQYSAPPFYQSMASINEPQINRQAMNKQAYTREWYPQYSAPPLHQPMASINEPQMNGQAIDQQAYTRELDPQYLASPLNQSMLTTASPLGRRLAASKTEAISQMNIQAMNQQAYTRERDPQYPDLPLHLPMASINEPQMNVLAMNQQANMRKTDPQYSSPRLHLQRASINEQQMNGQTMNQHAYAREPDSQYSASLLNQSIPTTSSHGRRLSASRTETMIMASGSELQMNGQALNHHYTEPKVPSGHYYSMVDYPYSPPTQDDTYNMSPSTFQQHGSNDNAYHLQPLAALLPQHIKSDLSPSSVPFVPSAHSSTNGLTYNSAYGFGMSSGNNAANSRFGSDNVFSSQNGNSNVMAPQGYNNSGSNLSNLFTGHQNQQSPSLRHNQQLEQEQRYYESLDQPSNRINPSNQTQQQPRPSNY